MEDVASRYWGRPVTATELEVALREHPSGDLRPPTGVFVLAVLADEAVGCGGLRLLAGGVAELTRLHVAPARRRQGLGAQIVGYLERAAREAGSTRIRLDTRSDLIEARSLYVRLGYAEVPRFNAGPYAEHWFEKNL
jgi:ribosomal protein S18 acetylase RimI-like enzyme